MQALKLDFHSFLWLKNIMAVSACEERRKLGCIGKEVSYELEVSNLSQSVNYPPFRLFVHLPFLLAQTITNILCKLFSVFSDKKNCASTMLTTLDSHKTCKNTDGNQFNSDTY